MDFPRGFTKHEVTTKNEMQTQTEINYSSLIDIKITLKNFEAC